MNTEKSCKKWKMRVIIQTSIRQSIHMDQNVIKFKKARSNGQRSSGLDIENQSASEV
jgi:hypothetical protein